MIEVYYKIRRRLGLERYSSKRLKRYALLFPEEKAETVCLRRDELLIRRILIVVIGVCVLASALCVATSFQNEEMKSVSRNEYGGGSKEISVTAEVGGETYDISASIDSRRLSSEEIDEKLEAASVELFEKMKGSNEDFSHIEGNLCLDNTCSDADVSALWQISDYKLIDYKGNVQYDEDFKDGTEATIRLLLSVQDEKRTYEKTIYLYKPAEKSLSTKELIESQIADEQSKCIEEADVSLPSEVNGEEVTYKSEGKAANLPLVCILGVIGIAVLIYKSKKDEEDEIQVRREELQGEYPELVSMLSIYIGAGLSVLKTFETLAADYSKNREGGGERNALYEEILLMLRMMKYGKTEEEAYAAFGDRGGSPEYLRLAAVLESNRKNGRAHFQSFLQTEAREATSLRLMSAKRRGEKISSKLLLPMIMLFAIVLVVLIVPAFIGW